MNNNLEVLTVKAIMTEFKLSRQLVYCLMNMRGCPLMTGKDGKKYRITRGNWETWFEKAGHPKSAQKNH